MTTRERMEQAFNQWHADHPTPRDRWEERTLAVWAKDAFYEAYLAGFEHACDTSRTTLREAQLHAQDIAANHDTV